MTELVRALSACVLILAVAAIRALFGKRLHPGLRYALWGLVLLRLLWPGTLLSSPFSVQSVAERTEIARSLEAPRGADSIESMDEAPATVADPAVPERFARIQAALKARDLLGPARLIGTAAVAAAFLVSNARFYARLRRRRRPLPAGAPLRVYAVENLSSSCLFGHAVYVTAETAADETKLRHVLAHELSHHRHGDSVWAVLRCAALALHWYNPLVWWAAALSRQDSELFADAGALRRLGEEERERYGETLIALSARRAPGTPPFRAAAAMTNGKRALRERVTMIAARPRASAAVTAAALLLAVTAAGCAFTGAEPAEPEARQMSAEEALDALAASVEWHEFELSRAVSFTLPEGYAPAEDWNIHVAGRSVFGDGMSMSRHYFEGESWVPGARYSIELMNSGLTELMLDASLPDGNGGTAERLISLLTEDSLSSS